MAEKVEAFPITNAAPPPATPEPVPRSVRGVRWVLVVIAILSATFFYGLDNTVVADIQPAVVEQFNAIDRLPWVSVYTLFDVKWAFIACVLLFEIGSAVCGAAPSMTAFLIGRTICGLGGSGMYTGVMTMLSFFTTSKERSAYLGLTGLTWGLGTVLGPIIGGAFVVSSATWRWAFYINLVFGGVCAPVYLLLIPSAKVAEGTLVSRVKKVDIIGTALITGTLISLLMAISFGGVLYAWNSGRIIALFVVSGVVAIVFGVQQAWCIGTTPDTRAFPVQFLRNRELMLIFASETCATTLTFIPIYFLPLYFQFVKADSALESGVKTLPLVMFLVVTIVGNGMFTARWPWYQPWFLIGGIVGLVGSVLMYTTDDHTSDPKVYGYSILVGFGAGCFVTLCFSAAQEHVDVASIPLSVGFVCFAQLAGSALTLAIANSVFLNDATKGISAILPSVSRADVQRIISGVGSDIVDSLSVDEHQRVIQAIVSSMNKAYIIAIACGALSVILALFLKPEMPWKKRTTPPVEMLAASPSNANSQATSEASLLPHIN